MKNLFKLLIAAFFVLAMPAWAEGVEGAAQAAEMATAQDKTVLRHCPTPDRTMQLSQVSQADCCKGHKGVCGCRAGKIVCCDGTVSPNCTCHADSGFEN
jgi:hypothetical protein